MVGEPYRGPERRSSRSYEATELDMRYVMRYGDENLRMLADVSKLKEEMDEVIRTGKRLDRALNGGWTESGDEYVTGLRDQVRWLRPLAYGIWALVVVLVPVFANAVLHLLAGGKQ